jgi:WD40 repeat protein
LSSATSAPGEQATTVRLSPYVGLTHFLEDDAPFFFGREAVTRIIAANLAASRLTLVYGPSGVGKSSLLRAGVARGLRTASDAAVAAGRLPESIAATFSSWRDEPLSLLAEQIESTVRDRLGELAPDAAPARAPLDQLLVEWTELLDARARSLEEETGVRQPLHVELLVMLDQFEEYFVYHPGEEGPGTFAGEFPRAVNRRDLRANFLVSIREDAYTFLDRFEEAIPNVFGNNLRVEHLDADAAREAILGPVARYTELYEREGAPSSVEDALVETVVRQVRTGSVAFGQAGAGVVETEETDDDLRVEAPFLQLVLERLWEEEVAAGSETLRLATLERLGGAQKIVHAHLGQAMSALDPDAREAAASVFGRLVTPSGSKIAYLASDLAALEGVPLEQLTPVLARLADLRILRAVAPPPGESELRYEIFHDVLAPAILQWRAAHVYERDQRERERAHAEQSRRRQRRNLLFGIVGVALVGAIAAALLAAYALRQRDKAQRASDEAETSLHVANSERLTAAALGQLATNPTVAALLAERATQIKQTPQSVRALRSALAQPYFVRSIVARAQGPLVGGAFSADGTRVATAGDDGIVRLRSIRGGSPSATLRAHTELGRVGFSADGKFVAAGGADGHTYVWSVQTGRRVGVLSMPVKPRCKRPHPCSVTVVAFDPHAPRLLAARADGTSAIWAIPSGRLVSVLNGPAYVYDAAFSPDGSRVVTGSKDKRAYIWDAATGRQLHALQHRGPVNGVAFDPAGIRVATASWDRTAQVWNAATGVPLATLKGHTGRVYSVAFSPDGQSIVTASEDGTARIWGGDGSLQHVLRGHAGLVTDASFDRTGALVVTASTDGTGRVWTSQGNLLAILSGHTGAVPIAAFQPRGALVLTGGNDGAALLWRPAGAVRTMRTRGGGRLGQTNFSPDSKSLVVVENPQVAGVWDLASGERVAHVPTPPLGDYPQFAGNRSILTVTHGRAELWANGKREKLSSVGHPVRDAELSGDRTRVAVVTDDAVTVDALPSGRQIAMIRPSRGGGQGLSALPSYDGKLVAVGVGDHTEIWQVEPGRLLATVRGFITGGTGAEELGQGAGRFATAYGNGVTIWETRTGRRLRSIPVAGLAFTRMDSNGRRLITVTEALDSLGLSAQLWNLDTGKQIGSIGPSGSVASVHFEPRGEMIALGSVDGTTQVWDGGSGRLVESFPGQAPLLRTIFDPSGRDVAAFDRAGVARVFECDLCGSADDLLVVARRRIWRQLTAGERARFDVPKPAGGPARSERG